VAVSRTVSRRALRVYTCRAADEAAGEENHMSETTVVKAEHTMERHWQIFFVEGVVLAVLGIAALILPPLATIAVAVLFGWILMLGGIFGLVTTIIGRHAPGVVWSFLSSTIAIVAGGLLFFWPANSALPLTLILTGFLVADGLVTIMMALDYRRASHGRWIGLMINGVVDIVLAVIILVALPQSAAWAIGIIVGVDMLFGGSSLIALALAARNGSTP
jgi:uncharacterized membrane protein HdeD (DUF308 family)